MGGAVEETEMPSHDRMPKNMVSPSIMGPVQQLEARGKFEAIRELVRGNPALAGVKNLKQLEAAVVKRESAGFTACGHGVAFAHGYTKQVDQVTVALGFSRRGIEYNTPDGKAVHLLFVITSPPDRKLDYLVVLSSLARICYDSILLHEILHSVSIEEVESRVRTLFAKELAAR